MIFVAIAQCPSLVGKVELNLATVAKLCAEAKEQGADLILFPEAHATGYSYRAMPPLVKATAEPLSGPICQRLSALANQFSMVICCGMFEKAGPHYYNTHVIAFPDGRLESQRKGILTREEQKILSAGLPRHAFEWKGIRFGIIVCADHDNLADFRGEFQQMGISLLLHPSAGWIETPGIGAQKLLQEEAESCRKIARSQAINLGVSYAVANPIGFSGEDYYPGNSWLIHPEGGLLASLPATAIVEEMLPSCGVGCVIPKPIASSS